MNFTTGLDQYESTSLLIYSTSSSFHESRDFEESLCTSTFSATSKIWSADVTTLGKHTLLFLLPVSLYIHWLQLTGGVVYRFIYIFIIKSNQLFCYWSMTFDNLIFRAICNYLEYHISYALQRITTRMFAFNKIWKVTLITSQQAKIMLYANSDASPCRG